MVRVFAVATADGIIASKVRKQSRAPTEWTRGG
jgi:hypothetical protein